MAVARLIEGIAGWVGAVVCALTSVVMTWSAIDKVNERLPADQAIEILGWHADQYWKVRREYRRLYPDGTLVRNARRFALAAVALFAIGVWAMHVFTSNWP